MDAFVFSINLILLMPFDLIQGLRNLRLNGDFTCLLFQEKGSSWLAVTV